MRKTRRGGRENGRGDSELETENRHRRGEGEQGRPWIDGGKHRPVEIQRALIDADGAREQSVDREP